MTLRTLAICGVCLALAGPAFAQGTPGAGPTAGDNGTHPPTVQNQATMQASGAAGPDASQTPASQSSQQVRQAMLADLRKSGFTHIRIMPEAYMVHARDRSGRQVTMIVNPNSVLAVTDVARPAQGGNDRSAAQ